MIPRGTAVSSVVALWSLVLLGCDPYERRQGEFNAGSVDPANFPADYLGANGVGNMAGQGVFTAATAMAKGKAIFYFAFPTPMKALTPGSAALAYVFDPSGQTPIPQKARCVPQVSDPNYDWMKNLQQDAYPLNQQGNIFTKLPDSSGYVPLVAEVAVTSVSEPCQDIKSADTLLLRSDVTVNEIPPDPSVPNAKAKGKPDGKYLAWAIIDPTAAVMGPGATSGGLGLQQWGWYNHYLLAYLDGGYVPMDPKDATQLMAQNLYYPDTVADATGMPMANAVGAGADLLDAARGDAGYSPLCQIIPYTPADPKTPPFTDVAALMTAATAGMVKINAPTGYTYCLQVK